MTRINVRAKQAPLRQQYKESPESARVVDHAVTSDVSPSDPFHATVAPMPGCGATLAVGVHRAVGGAHDAPTPGDILCAALAACQDSSIRMVANILGIELESVSVDVKGEVDVRGTMAVDRDVPVGFQAMHCDVQIRAAPGTPPELLQKLYTAAERCCVVQQTLKQPPAVTTKFTSTPLA